MWWFWLGLGLTVGACVGVVLAGLLASAGREDDRMMNDVKWRGLVVLHHREPPRIGACPVCRDAGRPDLAEQR